MPGDFLLWTHTVPSEGPGTPASSCPHLCRASLREHCQLPGAPVCSALESAYAVLSAPGRITCLPGWFKATQWANQLPKHPETHPETHTQTCGALQTTPQAVHHFLTNSLGRRVLHCTSPPSPEGWLNINLWPTPCCLYEILCKSVLNLKNGAGNTNSIPYSKDPNRLGMHCARSSLIHAFCITPLALTGLIQLDLLKSLSNLSYWALWFSSSAIPPTNGMKTNTGPALRECQIQWRTVALLK